MGNAQRISSARIPAKFAFAYALALAAVLGACRSNSNGGVDWPKVAKCAPSPDELVERAANVLFKDGSGKLSDRALRELEDLGREHGPSAVVCAVNTLIGEIQGGAFGASPNRMGAQKRAREFLDKTGTKIEIEADHP